MLDVSDIKETDFSSYTGLSFHEKQEEIVDILCSRTGNNDRSFFRVMVIYKFAELATNMRINFDWLGSKNIPCNVYALDLAPSGYSKNASMNILEKEIFRGFKDKFMLETFESKKLANLATLANDLSIASSIDMDDANSMIKKEYNNLPKYMYSFGSSTPEGFKAMRTKLSMAGIGATNNIVDEIGSNLVGNQETLTVQLESYDTGDSKNKLIKTDSNSELKGSVPSNLFAFGTHSKLLDGGDTEKKFFELLETGYGRRFLFGFVDKKPNKKKLTAVEMYDEITSTKTSMSLASMSKDFEDLADDIYFNKTKEIDRDVALLFIDYRLKCEEIAENLKDHEEIKKAVIAHGYWRALKIACCYAFIDKTDKITSEQALNAIALVEDSNNCFNKLLSREKPYERLAKYVSDIDRKVTQVDLVEDLPFYKGSESQKRELMTLAIAYGYQNNIIIKKTIKDGVEFLEGDRLKETNLDEITCSYSKDITTGYKHVKNDFFKLHQLVSNTGFHYTAHGFRDGHRKSENAIKGFNLLILDVDSGTPVEVARNLLKDYVFLIATTKRHKPNHHRYRIILPMSHRMELNQEEHKRFMKNVFKWLPFEVDEQTADIARKWESFKGDYWYNEDGLLIDPLPFIPDTSKAEEQEKRYNKYEGTEALQRWFLINNRAEDGRNNCLRDYALALLDNGMNSDTIRHSVYDMNDKLEQPLETKEIESTILKTVIRKEIEREATE